MFFLLLLNKALKLLAGYLIGKFIILDAFRMVLYGHPGVSLAMNVKSGSLHRRPMLDLPSPACAFLITREGRKH